MWTGQSRLLSFSSWSRLALVFSVLADNPASGCTCSHWFHTECEVQMCIVAADAPVDLASPGIKRQVKHAVPLQLQGEAGAEVYVQADRHAP